MGFFKKSGNSRGVFQDGSIEELKSLFTNDDEKDASCPCSIADNPNSPTTPNSCEPSEPVYLPSEEPQYAMREYILQPFFDAGGIEVTWLDINNVTQGIVLKTSRTYNSFTVCAIENSVKIDGVTYWPANIPCPPGPPCLTSINPTLNFLGNC